MKVVFTTTLLIALALAGCTSEPADSNPTPTAPTDVTPTVTASPDLAPPGENETDEEPMTFLDCTEPAATSAAPGEVLGYPEVVFTVQEPSGDDPCFGFVGPASVPAGWTAITLQNNGMQPHIMPMFRLAEGRTLEDVKAYLADEEAEGEPDWATPVGGVGVATPFSSGTVLMDLQEGTYALVCFFGGHHAQGMYRLLNVTAADENASAEAPEADHTIELTDFAFQVPNMTAGTHIVRVVNNGSQPHEAPLIKLNANATMQQFLEAIESETAQGPPPGAGVGGVNTLAPGQEAYFVARLTAGDYGFVCFVSSPEHEGKPHVALGMVTQFTVAEATA